MPDDLGEIVYVLTNPAMPGLAKIGITREQDITSRMNQLYTVGVPVPFECEFACVVSDSAKVEKALHFAFGDSRVNPKREFFRVDPAKVRAILELLMVKDVTPQVESEMSEGLDAIDRESRDDLKRTRRPTMNFREMNIPVGATLTYGEDPQVQVKVVGDRQVEYNGAPCSLLHATKEIKQLTHDIRPAPYWTYNGKSLAEIYEETYVVEDEV